MNGHKRKTPKTKSMIRRYSILKDRKHSLPTEELSHSTKQLNDEKQPKTKRDFKR